MLSTQFDYKYVWINATTRRPLGEFWDAVINDAQVLEPTLDQLVAEGWEPDHEVAVAPNSSVVIMKRPKCQDAPSPITSDLKFRNRRPTHRTFRGGETQFTAPSVQRKSPPPIAPKIREKQPVRPLRNVFRERFDFL